MAITACGTRITRRLKAILRLDFFASFASFADFVLRSCNNQCA